MRASRVHLPTHVDEGCSLVLRRHLDTQAALSRQQEEEGLAHRASRSGNTGNLLFSSPQQSGGSLLGCEAARLSGGKRGQTVPSLVTCSSFQTKSTEQFPSLEWGDICTLTLEEEEEEEEDRGDRSP